MLSQVCLMDTTLVPPCRHQRFEEAFSLEGFFSPPPQRSARHPANRSLNQAHSLIQQPEANGLPLIPATTISKFNHRPLREICAMGRPAGLAG